MKGRGKEGEGFQVGVKYARAYHDIISDLTKAIREVDAFYEFFHMDRQMWNELGEDEQRECIRTMADDIFYGLGGDPTLHVGRGVVHYDGRKHVITVDNGQNCINIVFLK